MSRLRPAPGVAVVEEGDVVYAAPVPDGQIAVLDGGAAAIWVAARAGERDSIAERVAELTGAPLSAVQGEVERIVDDLVRRGLLVADPEDAPA
ncbi:PqqD family peptide modification chaperone [Agromyces sp. NPDC057865]|uniref:PqqD family peptide modification chaperone n=1 Tax=Agromyces sp. NPDC057865 TaxID=3346267 RepID=UPI003672E50E